MCVGITVAVAFSPISFVVTSGKRVILRPVLRFVIAEGRFALVSIEYVQVRLIHNERSAQDLKKLREWQEPREVHGNTVQRSGEQAQTAYKGK